MKSLPLALLLVAIGAVAALLIMRQFVRERELQMAAAESEAKLSVLRAQANELRERHEAAVSELRSRLESTEDEAERGALAAELEKTRADHADEMMRMNVLIAESKGLLADIKRELGDEP